MEETDAALAGCRTSTVDFAEQQGIDACALAYAARRLCRDVWPGQRPPSVLPELARRLREAPARVLELQESAARGGALWAVSLLKSWYPDADLELLKEGFRDDDSYDALKEHPTSAMPSTLLLTSSTWRSSSLTGRLLMTTKPRS